MICCRTRVTQGVSVLVAKRNQLPNADPLTGGAHRLNLRFLVAAPTDRGRGLFRERTIAHEGPTTYRVSFERERMARVRVPKPMSGRLRHLLEDLGNVGDFLGGLDVVLTLEFLALIASGPGLADLWVRAIADNDDDLDHKESVRASILMGNVVAILKAEFDAEQHDDQQPDSSYCFGMVVRSPGFR